MRKNNTIIIVLIAGIFLILLLAAGTLGYAVFTSGSKTAAVETAKTAEKEDKKNADDTIEDSEKTEKKEEKPKQSKVTLDDLKNKKAKNTEYIDNLGFRMRPVHRLYTMTDREYENTQRINDWAEGWDEELNTVYQLLMKKLTPSQQEELRTEQRKWIKMRDTKLGNSEDDLDKADLFYNLTMDRTYELAKLYDKVK